MKKKRYRIALIVAVCYFILINTTYFWEGKLGFFHLFFSFFLIAVFIGLFACLFRILYVSVRERFVNNRERNIMMVSLAVILGLVLIRPDGLIDFEKRQGEDVLVAFSEGAANCTVYLKLKENRTFSFTEVCFGLEKIKGSYTVVNDTIVFDAKDDFYQYALCDTAGGFFAVDTMKYKTLRLFESQDDARPHRLYLMKNRLIR